MKVTVRPELKMMYPGAVFGCLTVRDAANMRMHEGLEAGKRRLGGCFGCWRVCGGWFPGFLAVVSGLGAGLWVAYV